MSLQQYREAIRTELLLAGFETRSIAESPLENVDVSLTTPCFQAFFTVVDGIDSLEQTWKSIQETIAKYKSENRNTPRDLYLTFLLLEAVSASQLPLLQAISSDPLVCRKIILPTDPDHVSVALGSLPFMSMGIDAMRPTPSVQDIFGALGTRDYPETVLSILSDRASAERIVTRLLELPVPFGIPSITPAYLATAGSPTPASAPCRFEALRVRNFRGIRDAEVDLSANITIIYGQNGTGKTSLFEAIEWALVGTVERIDSEDWDDTSGLSPYVNLFTVEPASVSADVSIANVRTTITRTCERDRESHLAIDGREGADDREVFELIIGQQAATLDIRILRRLVRTSCFLSQSTLRSFLSDDPKERYWSLAHLLGTQDYVRLLEKIDEVKKVIDRGVHEFDEKVEALSKDLESIRAQIRSREALISNTAGAQELDRMLAGLVNEAANKLTGLQSPYTILFPGGHSAYQIQSSIAVAADWVDKEFRQARDTRERLLLALDAANRRSEVSATVEELSRRKLDIGIAFARANAQLSLAEQEKASAASELAQLTRRLDHLIELQSKQREALVIMQHMGGLRTLTKEQEDEVAAMESELSSDAATRAQLAQELTRLTSRNQHNMVTAKQLRDEIRALDEAESAAATFHQLALELPSLEQTTRDADASITEQQQIVSDLRVRTTSLRREIAALSSERERQMGSVEKLRVLLADIQQYLVGSECPLCGSEWHSTDELKRAVDERTSWLSPKVKQLDEQLLQMQQRLTGSQTSLAQAEEVVAQLTVRRDEAQHRSSEITNIGAQIRELLLRARLSADADTAHLLEQRQSRAASLAQVTEVAVQEEGALARLRDELNRLELETTRKEDRRQRMAAHLASNRRRLNEMVTQLEAVGLGLEPDAAALQQQIQEISHESETVELSRMSTLKKVTDSEAILEEKKAIVASEERSLAETTKSISTLNDALRRMEYTLRDAQLDADVGVEVIRIKVQESEARTTELEDVRNTLNRLNEISSWLLARREITELNSKLISINDTDEAMRTERSTLSRWNSHLESFTAALVDIKAEVETIQLTNYGPTINLLYQRLSTHPIFRELRVSVDTSKQSVSIQLPLPASFAGIDDHTGLAPAQYLSEAQLNVAALSIFLSHSFQQRWSLFEPLFLDDPVQNMDDFNANGFIDCLRSLAVLDRQFVISTCDISFYRLLLLKLRCMNYDGQGRFRAYRLEGISEEGPSVVQDFPTPRPSNISLTQSSPIRVN